MQKIPLLIVFIVSLLTNACWKKHEPSPDDEISSMSVSARKVNDEVILSISAYTFRSPVGPEPTNFDAAEVWISEEISGLMNMELAYTTSQETLKLENLKPDKSYYVSVKGIKNGVKSGFSKVIMFITRSIKPDATILELPDNVYMKSSSNSPYLAYVNDKSKEVILQNWQDKSKKVIYKNTATKTYSVLGFYAQGNRIFLETSKNNNRAFEYYDLTTQKFTEIDMPAGARIWNFAFSPDGSKMAYTDYDKKGLFIYDTGTKENKLFSGEYFYSFDWSHDGKNIIQFRDKPNAGGNIKEVVKFNTTDTGLTTSQIFEWPETMGWVMLSPKEDYIMFGSNTSNNRDLWIAEIKTKKLWQISDADTFGWLSDKEFFVNIVKAQNETTWKTNKYILP